MELKFSTQIPNIYYKLRDAFGIKWSNEIIITYGDTVYCERDIDEAKKVHEATHVSQQSNCDPDEWYDKYINNVDFRLSQEIEAYKNEIKFYKKKIKDRNLRYLCCEQVYRDISSSIYGNMISYSEAKKLLS